MVYVSWTKMVFSKSLRKNIKYWTDLAYLDVTYIRTGRKKFRKTAFKNGFRYKSIFARFSCPNLNHKATKFLLAEKRENTYLSLQRIFSWEDFHCVSLHNIFTSIQQLSHLSQAKINYPLLMRAQLTTIHYPLINKSLPNDGRLWWHMKE